MGKLRCVAGAARRCLTGVGFLSYCLEINYRQVLGLVSLASSEQTVLVVNVCGELVGRAQMTNEDDTQVAPGSRVLARPLHSKKLRECYHCRLNETERKGSRHLRSA